MRGKTRKPRRSARMALTEAQESALAADAEGGMALYLLAAKYAVSENTARRVLARAGVTPTRGKTTSPPRPEQLAAFVAMGDPPDDPLEAQVWMHRALALCARHIMVDSEVDDSERRTQLTQISRAMAMMVPRARLFEAEQTVRDEAGQLNAKAGPDYDQAADVERFRAPKER